MARSGQRQSGANRSAERSSTRRARDLDNEGIIPVLARAVREVETGVQRGRMRPALRTKFQVVALLVREERARVNADQTRGEAYRAEQLRRLDGIATILAKTAARDTSLLALLADDAIVSVDAEMLKHDLMVAAGMEPPAVEAPVDRRRRRAGRARAAGGAAVGGRAAARQPVPHPRLLGAPRRARPRPDGWRAGS